MKRSIHESGEMYLEHILELTNTRNEVRSIDVANATGYSRPSVSRAMGLLRTAGLIEMDETGYITLTEEGKHIAERVYERHNLLTEMFERLGVSHDTAVADACRIEHVISEETFSKIKAHMENLK